MASEIYKTMFNRKIENFVNIFSGDSSKIFKDESDRLIHPGEFGMYRERICKEILRLILQKDVEISDGFIITSNNKISTQCDIIVYNAGTMPLVTNDIAQMFPIEEVRAIGEIKSNLNKNQFKEALVKLAKNKELYEEREASVAKKKYKFKTYDTIPTFLICNKLDFKYNNIDFKDDIYGDIPRKYWHNVILSVDDAFISYYLDYSKGNIGTIALLKNAGYNFDIKKIHPYPEENTNTDIIETIDNYIYKNKDIPNDHIAKFFTAIAICIRDEWVYYHDPVSYLGFGGESPFMKK